MISFYVWVEFWLFLLQNTPGEEVFVVLQGVLYLTLSPPAGRYSGQSTYSTELNKKILLKIDKNILLQVLAEAPNIWYHIKAYNILFQILNCICV